ncbi:UNVERIFIED_CONTAM: hypothetical protein Scaly_1015700 [Sesamum calycinum]|uniref:HAT C-terminal dimerisation domain-containing protein n=1 Tax=Sesamum calycinum TaxID=2727403 RepID=A0AAW2QJG0_9LAMI
MLEHTENFEWAFKRLEREDNAYALYFYSYDDVEDFVDNEKDILATLVSTIASEQAFSTTDRLLDSYRSSLNPKTVEALICTQSWLCSKPINIEETMGDVENYEEMHEGIVFVANQWRGEIPTVVSELLGSDSSGGAQMFGTIGDDERQDLDP